VRAGRTMHSGDGTRDGSRVMIEASIAARWRWNVPSTEGREPVSANRAVAYQGPGEVDVVDIDYPDFELKDGPGVNPANVGRKLPHGAVIRTIATNICGSDQHMVRGRTTVPQGLVLGHEITGEVVEVGPDVEFVDV